MVLGDKLHRLAEQALHARLGEDAAYQFNMLRRSSNRGRNRSAGRRLKRVSIKARCGLGDTCAVLAQFVHVLQHREGLLPDERHYEWLHHTRCAHTDNATDFGVHHVFDIDLAFDNTCAWVDRLGQTVERVTKDVRLDKLNVHRHVGNRHAEECVRLWIGAEIYERNKVAWFPMQNLVGCASNADAAKFRDPVAVHVNIHIAFNVEDFAGCRICAACDLNERLRVTVKGFLVAFKIVERFKAKVLNLIEIIAHLHKIGYGNVTTVGYKLGCLNRTRTAVNQKLFGRYRLNAQTALLNCTDYCTVIGRGLRLAHHAHRRFDHHLAVGNLYVLNFDIGIGLKDGECSFVQTRKVMGRDIFFGIPPNFHDTVLTDQGVLECGIAFVE